MMTTSSPPVSIAIAAEPDVARIAELSNWAALNTTANFATAPEPVEQWLASWRATAAMHPWLVARVGEWIAGFARSSPHRARAAYDWTAEVSVYVDPERHGRGIGRALYAVLIPILRRQGYMTLLAGITAGHRASERLHAACGFTPCGAFHRAGWKLGAWHDVGYWELHLQPPEHVPSPIRLVRDVDRDVDVMVLRAP